MPLFEYAPRRIKMAVTGVGGARKEQVKSMLAQLVAELPDALSLDEADALAVAVCHANRMTDRQGVREKPVLRGL